MNDGARFLACRNDSGVYMRTLSGREFSLTSPSPEHVSIDDIAWHLSRIARFNGAVHGPSPLTVAEHSVTVERTVGGSPTRRLCALLHDAHEAYIGDIIRPVALALGDRQLGWLKARVQCAIHEAFALPWPISSEWERTIKEADEAALFHERDVYVLRDGGPASSHEEARIRFLSRFNQLRWLAQLPQGAA